jgi:hypothetical protein
MVVVGDALALVAMAFPAALDQAASWVASGSRLAGASIAPVIVLLLTSLLPSDLKASLVFWRGRDALPGHRAFSVYAPGDPRIDLQRLRTVTGPFPEVPRDQNALWYGLFKKVEGNPAVTEAHRHFLLLRDLAALSLLLAVIAPIVFYLFGATSAAIGLAVGLFGIQYLATAIAARHHGVRMVCNVLALHGAAATPRKPAGRPKA